jgi:tetratricopeptide (TPR) repeat protein
MELLYNPDRMPEAEIKATFVAREALVDELVELVKSQPDSAGMQHAVIIAPRGMGKTTVLLMVKFAIKDRGLADQWQAVKFPEESYGIYDLSDFWLETLHLIAADTADAELRKLADDLKTKYPNNDDLQEAAYAALKDWRRRHGKRLLLLVENFDQILEQINDERDNARLRDVLMNDGTVMLLGGATTFFKEARAYDQPLYNFFKIYNLHDLKFAQMQQLLRCRASLDRVAGFENSLKQNEVRLRVLEYFTGGSPRLVLMLYRVVTQSDVGEVRRALEKLLDEVTPYYKAKIEILPPQQRKILDHIARVSGQTNEGLTPKEIAEAVRLPQNQVSAQLKRLSELGYVHAANLRGRSSFYMLSEPLYAIWHQMRFGRSMRERMNWLVSFLRVWYEAEEMVEESVRLDRNFQTEMRANHMRKARNLLEHHRYLAEAISDVSVRTRTLERVIRGHLELNDITTVKDDLLVGIKLTDLSDNTLDALLVADCINNEQIFEAKASKAASVTASEDKDFANAMAAVALAYDEKKYEQMLQQIDRALKIKPDEGDAWLIRGFVIGNLGRYEEAVASFDQALKIKPEEVGAWINRSVALGNLGRHEESLAGLNRALAIKSDNAAAWFNHGIALESLGRHEEALASFDHALTIAPNDAIALHNRGITLGDMGRHEEALATFDRVLELTPDDESAWYNRGAALGSLGRYEEAVVSFDRSLEIKPEKTANWVVRGMALGNIGQYQEAITSFDHALEIKPDDSDAWFFRGIAYLKWVAELTHQEKFDVAKEAWLEALVSGGNSDNEDWLEEVAEALLGVAKAGHLIFARQLIAETEREDQFFPLARALDYLQTGDEALIEKLSPEVRGIVEEIIAKLKTVTPSTQAAAPPPAGSAK